MQTEAREWALIDAEIVQDYGAFRVRRDRGRSPRTGDVHTYHVQDAVTAVRVVAATAVTELIAAGEIRHAQSIAAWYRYTLAAPSSSEASESP